MRRLPRDIVSSQKRASNPNTHDSEFWDCWLVCLCKGIRSSRCQFFLRFLLTLGGSWPAKMWWAPGQTCLLPGLPLALIFVFAGIKFFRHANICRVHLL